MNIEVVEFYPIERNDKKEVLKGTLHVYLIDLALDIRGIFVSKKKNFWHFYMPHQKGIDQDTSKPVKYPIFSFMKPEQNKNFLKVVREKGKEYILKNLELT